jgi:tetratricopeptide (TPR) repeat protein
MCPEARTYEELKGVLNVNNTVKGARTKDPDKYKKDAAVLEQGLIDEPNNSRYMFYLGQCYGNAGECELAIKAFKKRALMGGGEPEIFWSLYCVGKLQESLNLDGETIIDSYWRAHQAFPHRVEPLYRIASIHLKQNSPFLAYLITKEALTIPPTRDNAMVERWIYDWGMEFLFATSAYYVGSWEECKFAVVRLLNNPTTPEDIREILEKNLRTL